MNKFTVIIEAPQNTLELSHYLAWVRTTEINNACRLGQIEALHQLPIEKRCLLTSEDFVIVGAFRGWLNWYHPQWGWCGAEISGNSP